MASRIETDSLVLQNKTQSDSKKQGWYKFEILTKFK